MIMRVLNVNSSLDLKIGAGLAERTFQMSRFLAKEGVSCTALTLDLGLTPARAAALAPVRVVALPCLWQRFYVPRFGWRTIRRLVNEVDVVHLMGHWSVLNVLAYFAARLAGKPYVVCPAGCLPLFGRSRGLKRLYNTLIGNAIIRNASAWIAVTEGELPHFEEYGISASQVVVIPNGVSEDDFPLAERQGFFDKFHLPDAPMILFMGRLNPIKGPDLLLQAFIQVCSQLPAHQLVFAGPDGGMLSELQAMVERQGLKSRVRFLGYIEGVDKASAYRIAQLLVVPSRQEAMSIVALEAGICGTPALLTDQCGFSEIRSIDPRLEVPASVEGIAGGLMSVLGTADALQQIAPLWQRFVKQQYAWDAVVLQFIRLYETLLKRNHRA